MDDLTLGRLRVSAVGPVAVLGTHFNHPTAGRILRHGNAWRFVAPA